MLFGKEEKAKEDKATDAQVTVNNCAQGVSSGLSRNECLMATVLAQTILPHLDKIVAERLAEIQKLLEERLDLQDAAFRRLHQKFNLILEEDGRVIVNVPEHLEIRKVAKAK